MKIKYLFKKLLLTLFIHSIAFLHVCSQGNEPAWKDYEKNPIVTIGQKGSWDAGALGSMTVLKVDDTFHMYYEAWGVRTDSEWGQGRI